MSEVCSNPGCTAPADVVIAAHDAFGLQRTTFSCDEHVGEFMQDIEHKHWAPVTVSDLHIRYE